MVKICTDICFHIPEHLSSPPVFSGVRVARSLVFSVVFCKSFFVIFFWPLYCLSSFELRLLINPLVYSDFFVISYRLSAPLICFLSNDRLTLTYLLPVQRQTNTHFDMCGLNTTVNVTIL